jgi:formamidopyrimidine-DNA glycosylase
MRRYLQATSLHQEIENVRVDGVQLLERMSPDALKEGLVGRSFTATRRHGKYVFVALDGAGEGFLVLHFGMTGGLRYFKHMDEEPEHDRVLFDFASRYHLAYISLRKLGEMTLVDDVERFIERRELGPDVLHPDFSLEAFKEVVEGRRVMAKALLMDQHTLAGIGNVYADEILFQAGVHPRTKISELDQEALEALFHTMRGVLREAVEHQAHPDRFPDSFIVPHRHDEGRCPRCGAGLERVQVSSRTSYFCPNCQPKEDG